MATITEKTAKNGKICGFCSTGGRHDLCPGGVVNGDGVTIVLCTCPEHPVVMRCVNCGARGDGISETTWTCLDAESCAQTSQKRRDDALRDLYGDLVDGERTRTTPKATRAPKAPREAKTGTCICGCEGTTKGGLFLPGHDSKYLTGAVASIQGGKYTLAEVQQLMATQGCSVALQEKLAKRVA